MLPEVSAEALDAAHVVQNKDERAEVLSALVPLLLKLPINQINRLSNDTLTILSQRKRSDLFSDILNLLPIFSRIGEEKLYQQNFRQYAMSLSGGDKKIYAVFI